MLSVVVRHSSRLPSAVCAASGRLVPYSLAFCSVRRVSPSSRPPKHLWSTKGFKRPFDVTSVCSSSSPSLFPECERHVQRSSLLVLSCLRRITSQPVVSRNISSRQRVSGGLLILHLSVLHLPLHCLQNVRGVSHALLAWSYHICVVSSASQSFHETSSVDERFQEAFWCCIFLISFFASAVSREYKREILTLLFWSF